MAVLDTEFSDRNSWNNPIRLFSGHFPKWTIVRQAIGQGSWTCKCACFPFQDLCSRFRVQQDAVVMLVLLYSPAFYSNRFAFANHFPCHAASRSSYCSALETPYDWHRHSTVVCHQDTNFGTSRAKVHKSRPNILVFLVAKRMIDHLGCRFLDVLGGMRPMKVCILTFEKIKMKWENVQIKNVISFLTFSITSTACIARLGSLLCWVRW